MTQPKETAWREFLADLVEQEGPQALDVLTALAPEMPHAMARGRARLLDAAALGGRLWQFDEQVAALLDLTREAARKLLDLLDTPEVWAHPMPGVAQFWVTGGPRVAGALCGFLRIQAGMQFPKHEHLGDETVLVLQGMMLDPETGVLVRPGERDCRRIGTAHIVAVPPGGPDLLMLAVVYNGLSVNGVRLTPKR